MRCVVVSELGPMLDCPTLRLLAVCGRWMVARPTDSLLLRCSEGKAKRPVITSRGFAFLFKDAHTQVWDYVISLLETVGVSPLSAFWALLFVDAVL